MISEKDLAIVRAALQFFDEEISPSGDDVLSHYLDDRGIMLRVTTDCIATTRERFDKSSLFYARKMLKTNVLESVKLVSAVTEEEIVYQADRVELVSVLVTEP